MAHQAAWEGAEQGEEAVEEAATTIFQKIVRFDKNKTNKTSIKKNKQNIHPKTKQTTVEEAATTIFQKIVRFDIARWKKLQK